MLLDFRDTEQEGILRNMGYIQPPTDDLDTGNKKLSQ